MTDSFHTLVDEAILEAQNAMRRFPQPNYVISKVAEEAGEVVKAAIHCAEGRETVENLGGEMKQLIAMLYRLWVEGDQVHGLGPVGQNVTFARRYMGQIMAECDCPEHRACEEAGRCLAHQASTGPDFLEEMQQ
jgi:hypothetical protein